MGEERRGPRAPEEDAKIGPLLERKRLERGLSLEEVERATKIRKRYIEGLEKDDYGVLPDAVYTQGFLKTYANFLGLDGDALAGELKKRRQPRRDRQSPFVGSRNHDFDRPLVVPGGVAPSRRSPISGATAVAVAVAVLGIGALIGGLYYVGADSLRPAERAGEVAGDRPENPPARDGQGAGGGSGQVGGDVEQAAAKEKAPAAPESVRVVVEVEGSASWISVTTDGVLAFEQVAEPGFTRAFEAEQQGAIHTGNAGAVSVRVNGREEGVLGDVGEVVTRDWSRRDVAG